MNDKEAFEKWWMEGFSGMSDKEIIKYKDIGKQTSLNGWQAACAYKKEEIQLRIKQADKIIKDRQDELNYLVNKVEKLENKLKIAINED